MWIYLFTLLDANTDGDRHIAIRARTCADAMEVAHAVHMDAGGLPGRRLRHKLMGVQCLDREQADALGGTVVDELRRRGSALVPADVARRLP